MLPLSAPLSAGGRTRRHRMDRLVRLNVLVAATSCGWFLLALAGWRGPLVLGWVALPVSAALTTILCLQVSAAAGRQPALRSFWRSMAVAATMTGLAGTLHYRDMVTS